MGLCGPAKAKRNCGPEAIQIAKFMAIYAVAWLVVVWWAWWKGSLKELRQK